MANWSMAINGTTVSSVIRAAYLKRKVNGVSTLSATLALPVVAGVELTLAQRDAIVLTSPESRIEFRGMVTSVTSDGRSSVSFEAEDRLSGVRDLSVATVYTGDDQSGITEDIAENLMPAADVLTLDDDLDAADLVTLGTFTVAQMSGLEALLRLHQTAPSGRAPHILYHEPSGDVLRLETLGAVSSGVTLALGAGLRAPPQWEDTSGRIQNSIIAYTETATETVSDAASQTAYGLRAASYNRPDFGDADLATLAAAMLAQLKDATFRVPIACRWKDIVPSAGSPLNKTYVIMDTSRNFASDAAKISNDTVGVYNHPYIWARDHQLSIPRAVNASCRISIEVRLYTGSAWSGERFGIRLYRPPTTDIEIMGDTEVPSDTYTRFYVDIGVALRAGDVIKVYSSGGTIYEKNLRVCYDAGQATLPLVEYEMQYPGSRVYATFDEVVVMEAETVADLGQRVNVLENYTSSGGGTPTDCDPPNTASNDIQHHLFDAPAAVSGYYDQWKERKSWVVIAD